MLIETLTVTRNKIKKSATHSIKNYKVNFSAYTPQCIKVILINNRSGIWLEYIKMKPQIWVKIYNAFDSIRVGNISKNFTL